MMQPSEQTLTWACGGEHGVRPLPRSGTSWAESDTAYSATTANRSLDRRSVIMSRYRRYILWHTDVVQTTFMCNDSPELATYRKTMPDECFQQDGVVANCKQVYDDCLAQKMKEDKPDEIEQCIKSTFEEGDKPLFPGEGKRPSAHYSRPGQTSQASQAPWQKCLANAKDQAAKAKCFIDRENEFCGGLESDKTGCSNAIRSCHYDLYRKTGSTKKPAEDGQKQWDNIVACAKDRLAQTPSAAEPPEDVSQSEPRRRSVSSQQS